MNSLVHPTTLGTFIALEITLCLIPGPAVLFVIGSSLRRSSASGLSAALGILTGNALYFAASGFGVVSLLVASHELFVLLKWGGAIYLAVLGVRIDIWWPNATRRHRPRT